MRCHYCHGPAGTRDHIVPRAYGGLNRAWNVVPACRTCNGRKGSKFPKCRCLVCREAVERYRSGERGKVSRSKRLLLRRRNGVWRVTRRGGGGLCVTFRTLARAHAYAASL